MGIIPYFMKMTDKNKERMDEELCNNCIVGEECNGLIVTSTYGETEHS